MIVAGGKWCVVAGLMLLCMSWASVATSAEDPCPPVRIDVEGLGRVSRSVIDELLPREPPACYTPSELSEFERRIWGLGVFDSVAVDRRKDALRVKVREKWTLIPGINLSIGRNLPDSFFLLSLTEANLFGRAQSLFAYGAYAERQLGGEISWREHESAARRVTFEAGATYSGSSIFFDEGAYAWTGRWAGGRVGIRPPFAYGSQMRVAILAQAYHERSEGTRPAHLPSEGLFAALGSRVAWEGYEWHDLAPKGFRIIAELMPGVFLDGSKLRNRSFFTTQALSSIRITETTAVLVNTVTEGAMPGDANHSHLLGNIRGVRGLPDNLYRNMFHVFTNIELRFATALAPRWYLQGVTFVDAAAYSRMNAFGDARPMASALGAGIGVRLVPTVLALIVPRIDVGSLLWPEEVAFVNFGLSQYF